MLLLSPRAQHWTRSSTWTRRRSSGRWTLASYPFWPCSTSSPSWIVSNPVPPLPATARRPSDQPSQLPGGNIGNAKIEGLQEDLGLKSYEYNWCLTAFFFTYAAFEVPSNLLLKKLRPSRWLPSIMVAWGVVMTLMGIVQNYHGLLIARLFLGVAEAGLYPGVACKLLLLYIDHVLWRSGVVVGVPGTGQTREVKVGVESISSETIREIAQERRIGISRMHSSCCTRC